ncbi:phosphate signaling complex protein PhoU [Allofustis seminis]|uniref:phosphate signaling complex protein PhoU n=1 Tax=Allofustis seminis TaxID=166939 RepID=UPI00037F0D67|nr:phosphate signaling complex protein PhoU [Allofustis seminis]
MRQVFDNELEELLDKFTEMGELVNDAIYKAVKSFINHDKVLATEVIEQDQKINDLEKEIDVLCIELIALQQPNTSDLRRIVTTLQASNDLERMGDHAVSICYSTIRVKGNKRSDHIESALNDMGEIIKWMGQEIVKAFTHFDMEHAVDVASRDDEIDYLTHEVKKGAIKRMKNDPDIVWGAIDYVLVSNYIERIGDYVTNIAEEIVYLETGEIRELN